MRIAPPPARSSNDRDTFRNPLFRGADPWVVRHEGFYYWCNAGSTDSIEVWKSSTLTQRGERQTVWRAPKAGWNRAQIWAPELHRLNDRWHIYYAASDGRNANHRMGVLRSDAAEATGRFSDCGMLDTADRWAIDGTILRHDGQLYFMWSGWESHCDVQHLYGARMSDPCTISGPRVKLCSNDCHPWEHVGECRSQRGLHEGPQMLQRDGNVFLIYSCSGSWQPTYKLGMLSLTRGDDPLNPRHWRKHEAAVFESTRDVVGVGHCCFTKSRDGREDWIVYHAKTRRLDGWADRVVRAQRFDWHADGTPNFGTPISSEETMARPAGEMVRQLHAA